MGKIPEYTKRAIDNYRKKHYFMQLRFDRDIKERLELAGLTAAEVAVLVLDELERRENSGFNSD